MGASIGGSTASSFGNRARQHGEWKTEQALLGKQSSLGNSYAQLLALLPQLGSNISALEGQAAQGDPVFAAYRNELAGSLNFDQNGLPADLSRRIIQSSRGASASRGLLDSSTSGLQEVAALMGGTEAIRNQRLAQVNQYVGGVTQSAISALFPGIDTIYQGELQRAMAVSQGYSSAQGYGAPTYGRGNSYASGGGKGLGSGGEI